MQYKVCSNCNIAMQCAGKCVVFSVLCASELVDTRKPVFSAIKSKTTLYSKRTITQYLIIITPNKWIYTNYVYTFRSALHVNIL